MYFLLQFYERYSLIFIFCQRNNVRFFPNHGKNARIVPGSRGRTADRLYCEYEFSQSIVLVNQTLQDGELFAVSVDKLNDRWSGSIEVGKYIFITAIYYKK